MAETLNVFTEGLMMDANPLTMPNTALSNCLNGTLITFNGNEFILQNDFGNGKVETAYLPEGYVPVGIQESGGIIYVASYNPIKNQSQIGSFPSPERIISSDETSQPNYIFNSTIDFGWDNTLGATKEQVKLEIFDSERIFNPGDKFMISFQAKNLETGITYDSEIPAIYERLKQILSLYGVFNNGDINDIINTPDGPRNFLNDISIHLATLSESGKVTYIETDLLRNKSNGFWMWYYNGDLSSGNRPTPNEYRQSIGNTENYNIYKGKISAKLILIIELEGIRDFDLTRKVIPERKGTTNEYNNFAVEFSGNSDKYTYLYKDSSGYPDTNEYNGPELQGFKMELKYWKENEVEPEYDSPIYVNLENDYTRFTDLDSELNPIRNSDGTWTVGTSTKSSTFAYPGNENGFLRYKITPYTNFCYINRFTKYGLIDFSKVNSGAHSLTEWRYYSDELMQILNYGLDFNPMENTKYTNMYIEFFDVTNLRSMIWECKDRDSLAGNFIDVIPYFSSTVNPNDIIITTNQPDYRIQLSSNQNQKYSDQRLLKNNFYICRIHIDEFESRDDYEIWISDISSNPNSPLGPYDDNIDSILLNHKDFYRYMYTTPLFNERYVMDIEFSDFGQIDLSYDPNGENYKERCQIACSVDQGSSSIQFDPIDDRKTGGTANGKFYQISSTGTNPSVFNSFIYDTYHLNSKINITSALYNAEYYFGKYIPESIKSQVNAPSGGFNNLYNSTNILNNNSNYIVEGTLSDQEYYTDVLTNEILNNTKVISSTYDNISDEINSVVQISRGLVGDINSTYIEYTGKRLEQYIDDDILKNYGERSKRINPLITPTDADSQIYYSGDINDGSIYRFIINDPNTDPQIIEYDFSPKTIEFDGVIFTVDSTNYYENGIVKPLINGVYLNVESRSENNPNIYIIEVFKSTGAGNYIYPKGSALPLKDLSYHFGGDSFGIDGARIGITPWLASGYKDVLTVDTNGPDTYATQTLINEKILELLNNDELVNSTVSFIHGGGGSINLTRCELKSSNNNNIGTQNKSMFYGSKNVRIDDTSINDDKSNYMMVIWKSLTGSGKRYYIVNIAARHDDMYDYGIAQQSGGGYFPWMGSKTVPCMAESVIEVLKSFYLVQLRSLNAGILYPKNYIYTGIYSDIVSIELECSLDPDNIYESLFEYEINSNPNFTPGTLIYFDRLYDNYYNGYKMINPDYHFLNYFNNVIPKQKSTLLTNNKRFLEFNDIDPSFIIEYNLPPTYQNASSVVQPNGKTTRGVEIYPGTESNKKLILSFEVGITSSVDYMKERLSNVELTAKADLEATIMFFNKNNGKTYDVDAFGHKFDISKIYTYDPVVKYVDSTEPENTILYKPISRKLFETSGLSGSFTDVPDGQIVSSIVFNNGEPISYLLPIDNFGDITRNNVPFSECGMVWMKLNCPNWNELASAHPLFSYHEGFGINNKTAYTSMFGKNLPILIIPSITTLTDFKEGDLNEPVFNPGASRNQVTLWIDTRDGGTGGSSDDENGPLIYKDFVISDLYKILRASNESAALLNNKNE